MDCSDFIQERSKRVAMIKSELLRLWTQKEVELGRRLTVHEVAEATDVDRRAITRLLAGDTKQFQDKVVAPICKYFGLESGTPVSWIIYYENGNND